VVTLKGLLEEGLLVAAQDVLTVEYKGTITHASLTSNGQIAFQGELGAALLVHCCC
jgi:hypothetical protein